LAKIPGDTLVAIHQPNFLPWLGFFDKIRRSDVFVAMDNVQFAKSGGGTWTNRVQMIVNGQPAWVTVPIVRAFHGVRLIREMKITDDSAWRNKLLRTIEQNYRRAPHFQEVFPILEESIRNPSADLADYNLATIRSLCAVLNLQTPIVLGSSLEVEGHATELLISMVRAVGGNAYLAGGGAAGYQEDSSFHQAGVKLIYQEFQHPTYPQFNSTTFKPGLSVVDALMNCGIAGTADLLGTLG
jgi:hypothetical protein